MKITCDIIKDLLPLYHDDICSRDSCEIIEEHIEKCKECKVELENYDIEIKEIDNMIDAKPLKKISQKWKNDKKTSFLKGIFATSIIGCLMSIFIYNRNGSYIDENGYLIESFGLIPLAYLFGLITLISLIILIANIIVKHLKNPENN